MEEDTMSTQLSEEEYNRLKKKYSAEKDYKKILKYSKRKRTKSVFQI